MKAKPPKADISKLKKNFPECAERISIFDSIQKTVYSLAFKQPETFDQDQCRDLLSNGTPLINEITIDESSFAAALSRLLKHLSRNNSQFEKASGMKIPESILSSYLDADSEKMSNHSEELGISTAELVSCCQQALRPQLTAFAHFNSNADLSFWSESYCPFCGTMPAMAQVENTGIRRLFCPNCFSAYRFSRHHCPSCGNAGLDVLQMDAWPGLLIESCPKCSSYLKTWSFGETEPPCPFPWLDIVTHAVDEALELQGKKRISLSVLGV